MHILYALSEMEELQQRRSVIRLRQTYPEIAYYRDNEEKEKNVNHCQCIIKRRGGGNEENTRKDWPRRDVAAHRVHT